MTALDLPDLSPDARSAERAPLADASPTVNGSSAKQALLMTRALQFNSAFADWPATAIAQLVATATIRNYKRHGWIAHEEHERTNILVIVSGFLLVRRRTPDGDLHSVGLVGPGRIVGCMCRLMWTPQVDIKYSAHDQVKVIHLDRDRFIAQLNAAPRLWKSVLAGVLHQRREFVATLLDQTIGYASQRVARLIVRYANLYGMPTREPGSIRVPIRLPQADLAALLQMSRQTMGEAVRAFKESGWIRLDGATFTVLDPLALQDFAESRWSGRAEAPASAEGQPAVAAMDACS